jgi:hypothetical protein
MLIVPPHRPDDLEALPARNYRTPAAGTPGRTATPITEVLTVSSDHLRSPTCTATASTTPTATTSVSYNMPPQPGTGGDMVTTEDGRRRRVVRYVPAPEEAPVHRLLEVEPSGPMATES